MNAARKKSMRPATALVHGGTLRSSFEETSEALFLTQGFVYQTMEAAEARFKGADPGFIYSRFSNPTVAMFEARMADRARRLPRPLDLLLFMDEEDAFWSGMRL